MSLGSNRGEKSGRRQAMNLILVKQSSGPPLKSEATEVEKSSGEP
jgi:hypothetical protein